MISAFVSPLLALFFVGLLLSIFLAIIIGLVVDVLFRDRVRPGREDSAANMQITPHPSLPPAE